MSVQNLRSTADLRASAQDYKRDAAHKHKWALGAVESRSRGPDHPRPSRPKETIYNHKRAEAKAAVASIGPGARVGRKRVLLDDTTSATTAGSASSGDDSASSHSDDNHDAAPLPRAAVDVMYSFDAPRAPTHGSQILHRALAQAVERYEEKETTRLVKSEYDVLDSEGESMGLSPVRKKGNGKKTAASSSSVVPKSKRRAPEAMDEDDEYEFV